jgi:hypothetical protein
MYSSISYTELNMNTLVIFNALAVAVVGGALSPSSCTRVNPVMCDLNIAAEPCWAENSGVNKLTGAQILGGETTLTHVVGDQIITVDGTTISEQWIDGCIAVKANNVTITNSLIRSDHVCHGGNEKTAGAIIDNGNVDGGLQPKGLVIRDTEIIGLNVTSAMTGVGTHDLTCDRCNIHGVTVGVYTDDNAIVTNSYIHDPTPNAGEAHIDGVFIDTGNNILVEHSYITMESAPDWVSAAVGIFNDSIEGDAITVTSSFLEGGGGWDITGGAFAQKKYPYFTNLHIIDNALSPNHKAYATGFDPSATGNIWAGNKDSESGALVPAPGINFYN